MTLLNRKAVGSFAIKQDFARIPGAGTRYGFHEHGLARPG